MTVMDGDDPALPGPRVTLDLVWGDNRRDDGVHIEWHARCGCAYHPRPFPHVHPCSEAHKRPDMALLATDGCPCCGNDGMRDFPILTGFPEGPSHRCTRCLCQWYQRRRSLTPNASYTSK